MENNKKWEMAQEDMGTIISILSEMEDWTNVRDRRAFIGLAHKTQML